MGPVGPADARSPAEAVTRFFGIHQLAVSCVTVSVLTGQVYNPSPEPATMGFGGRAVSVGRHGSLALLVRHGYRFRPPRAGQGWRIETTDYAFRFQERDGSFLLAYHWHPTGNSPVTHPHLHVGCRTLAVDYARAHLPTGHVSLPAVLRAAIAEWGVKPLRADWDEILEQAERGPVPAR